jgi:hypothetical protein
VALTRPRVVFVVLLVAGALAGAYMLVARLRRSLGPVPGTGAEADAAALVLRQMWDAGPVLRAIAPGHAPGPRWGWAVPPLLRTAEYAVAVAAASWSGAGVGAACYAYLLVVIWHHYDSAYRLRRGMPGVAASPSTRFAGVELRTAAVVALAGAGAAVFTAGILVLAGALAVLAVVQSWSMWRRSQIAGVAAEGSGLR